MVAAPAVVVPGAFNRFLFGKLTVGAAGTVLAALAPAASRLSRMFSALIGAAVLLLLVAAIASDQPQAALLGRSPRYEGLFVVATYIAIAYAGARLLGTGARQRETLLALRALSVVIAVIALVSVLEVLGFRPLPSDVARPGALLGNASDQGALGLLAFGPLAVCGARHRDRVLLAAAGCAALVVAISASRGALVGLVIEFALVGLVIGGRRAILTVAALGGLLLALVLSLPTTRERVVGTSPLSGHTIGGRELLWRETLSLDASHLAFGVGPSNYKSAIVHEHDRRWHSEVGPNEPPDSPHSLPLQALTSGGVPLVVVFLIFVALLVASGIRQSQQSRSSKIPLSAGAAVALAGYGVALLVGFTSPGPMLLAALFVGILMSARGPVVLGRHEVYFRRAGAICMAGLTGVFLLAAIAEIPLRNAIIDVSRGDTRHADHAFRVAHNLRPWDVDLPDVAAHAFGIAAISDRSALRAGQRWLSRVPEELRRDEQVRLDAASLAEADGDYVAAIAALHAVLEEDPYNPDVLVQLGVVELEAGSLHAATDHLSAAAAIAPQDPGPWIDLAVAYHRLGDESAAARAADRARQLGSIAEQ